MRIKLSFLLMCCGFMACKADTNGTIMEIQHSVIADATCEYSVTNVESPSGYYDPMIDPTGFNLALVVRNNMQQRTDDPLDFGIVNVRNRVNDINMMGFEGCWYQATGDLTKYGSIDTTQIIDCDSLPNQSGTLTANGEIDEGGTSQWLSLVTVLNPTAMKQIFGSTFDASQIPVEGMIETSAPGNNVNDPNTAYVTWSNASEDPASPSRSIYWGTNYPQSRSAPVIIQLRAVGQTQDGEIVRSNWFTYNIEVCPGCLTNQCGSLIFEQCFKQLCGDGSTCSNGTCASGATGPQLGCQTLKAFSGPHPYFLNSTTQSVCLAAQAITGANCTYLPAYGCVTGTGEPVPFTPNP